jgi:hypothetical protein
LKVAKNHFAFATALLWKLLENCIYMENIQSKYDFLVSLFGVVANDKLLALFLLGKWFCRLKYSIINKKSDKGRLWKTKLLKTYGVTSVISTNIPDEKRFCRNSNKVLFGKSNYHFLRFHFENSHNKCQN